MNLLQKIVTGIVVAVMLFVGGFMTSEWTQTCPGCKTLATTPAKPAEKAQYCADQMVAQECLPDVRYYETIVPCDCTMEMEVGRVNGWAECVEAEKSVTSQKKKEEYCEVHYCQEKILRRTRPTTR